MTAPDDEFEDFLKRRKPVFRAPDDMFEPPSELDRVVLRQAREAIETPRPLRVFRGPRWAAPVALAATLVLAVGVVFHGGMPQKSEPVPEVTVQNVAERVDYPQAAPDMMPAPAPAPMAAANNRAAAEADTRITVVDLAAPPQSAARAVDSAAKSSAAPEWRRDTKTWLAEIERLRNAGDGVAADAELAEYRRQQRAFAGAPDR